MSKETKNHSEKSLDSVDLFEEQIGKTPKLTNREFLRNLKVARDKNADPEERSNAFQNMVKGNLALVLWRARRFLPCNRDLFSELIQAGNYGLNKAVKKVIDKWDPEECAFSTIAVRHIDNEFKKTLAFRLGMNSREYDQVKTLYLFIYQKAQVLGHIPTPKELVNLPKEDIDVLDKILTQYHDGTSGVIRLNKKRMAKRVSHLLNYRKNVLSFEESPWKDEEGSETLESLVPSPDGDPFKAVEKWQLAEEMKEMLNGLTPREERVLKLIYGVDGGSEQSRAEIARRMGKSRERIRQIEKGALEKLRHPSRTRKLKDYL